MKVETDEGVFGWGEAGLSGRELAVVGAVNLSVEVDEDLIKKQSFKF